MMLLSLLLIFVCIVSSNARYDRPYTYHGINDEIQELESSIADQKFKISEIMKTEIDVLKNIIEIRNRLDIIESKLRDTDTTVTSNDFMNYLNSSLQTIEETYMKKTDIEAPKMRISYGTIDEKHNILENSGDFIFAKIKDGTTKIDFIPQFKKNPFIIPHIANGKHGIIFTDTCESDTKEGTVCVYTFSSDEELLDLPFSFIALGY